MQTEKKSKAGPKRKILKRILVVLLAVVVILIVLTFFLVPKYLSSKKGRQVILTKINNAIEGRIDFDSLSMGWFKGITVWNFSFNDNAGQTSIQIRQIAAKPRYGSMLLGNLSFGKTVIDEPVVEINLKQPPEKAEVSQKEVSADKAAQPIVLPIKKIDLVVNNGNVKVTDSKAKTVELAQINSTLNLQPPSKQTDFNVDMAVVDEGKGSKIHAAAQISPGKAKTGWTLKGTSGDFSVRIDDLDSSSLAPFFTLAGVDIKTEGLLSADVTGEIKDGQIDNLNANLKATDLDVTGSELKGDRFKTSVLDIDVALKKSQQLLNIQKLQVRTDWLTANASGDMPTTFESLADFVKADSIYNLKGDFDCDLAAASSLMPHTFRLKEGTKISSGQLNGDIETLTEGGKRKIYGKANLVGLAGTVEGKTIAISQPVIATVEIASDKAGISFDKVDVAAAFGRINCTGTNELLNFNADVDLKKFQSELGQFADIGPYQVAGQLSSKGQASIKDGKFTAVGSSNLKNVMIASQQATVSEPAADIDFSFGIDRKNNLVTIDSVKTAATLGRFTIKDAILPLNEKAAKPMHLSIFAANVDLQKLQPFAVLFTSFPSKMQLAGTAESDISITSEKDTYIVKTDSTKIKNLKLRYPDQQPFNSNEVLLVFDAAINPSQKTINVKKLQLDSPQIKIRKGEIEQTDVSGTTKLKGQFDCEFDWAAVSTVAAPFVPGGLRLEGQNKLPIEFTSEYPIGQSEKLLANLSTKGKLGFEKAHYMGLNFGPSEAQIRIQKGHFMIEPFSTTVNNGQFSFAAQADFNQKPVLLTTPGPMQIMKEIQINDETANKLLKFINPIFANSIGISGVANFACEQLVIPLARDQKNHLDVEGTISVNELKLKPEGLLGQIFSLSGISNPSVGMTVHPTRFVLRDGVLQYDDMQIDIGDSPVNFKGTIGLDKQLNMTVTLPYTIEGRTARVGKETVGQRISIPLKGTIDRPELDTGKLLEEQIKQQIQRGVLEGLESIFK